MLIKIKVFPNSKKQECVKKEDGSFEIKTKAKAEQGKANEECLKFLSGYFKVSEKNVKIIKGFKQANKICKINDRQ